MTPLVFMPAVDADFTYLYDLCEATMRAHVEKDLGDCFEKIARPTIEALLSRGLFRKVLLDGVRVGAVAHERHATHIQLEELYVEVGRQQQGVGTRVMRRLIADASSAALPIRLHVLASNSARLFYEKLGFVVTRSAKHAVYMEYLHSGVGAGAA